MSGEPAPFALACPAPAAPGDAIVLGHGGGGRLTRDLIEGVFRRAFEAPAGRHDGAILPVLAGIPVFTTDAYVVRPLFFAGADIGSLAVTGTANDLAMCGARPRWLSAAFVLEEGLPLAVLERIVASMARAAADADVTVVTGDTKVVERGKADGLYVTTAGVGEAAPGTDLRAGRIRPGDAVLISGDLGRHGMAVLAAREGLRFESAIASDCAPLWPLVAALFGAGIEVHALRDLTRGGLATALAELAAEARVGVRVREDAIPVREDVASACELLGLDPLYVANEGRLVAFVPQSQAERALTALRACPVGAGASQIGEVLAGSAGLAVLAGRLGSDRLLDLLAGDQLPRIC